MPKEQISLVLSPRQRESLGQAISRYAETIETGYPYLAKRGISPEVAHQWQLGVAVDPVPGHEAMRGRLAIPYVTPAGPVGVVFRCIQDHSCADERCVKYLAPANTRRALFNVGALRTARHAIVITEGELDALVVTAVAGIPAVGVPGVQNWKPHWRYLFDGFGTVLVVTDGDDPGKKLAAKICGELRNAQPVQLPNGMDNNEFISREGVEEYGRHIGWQQSETIRSGVS